MRIMNILKRKSVIHGNFKIFMILLTIVIIILLLIYYHNFELEFSEVYTCTTDKIESNTPYWICIKDPHYNGFYSIDYLNNQYGVDYSQWDLENYTYVIAFGYEMDSIAYSYSKRLNLSFSKFLGQVTLKGNPTSFIHIYKLEKIDIDSKFPIQGYDEVTLKHQYE
ncbi:hypothetical protein Osc1_20720 [Hominimerdicola sp. 21CYCFAH17_S]